MKTRIKIPYTTIAITIALLTGYLLQYTGHVDSAYYALDRHGAPWFSWLLHPYFHESAVRFIGVFFSIALFSLIIEIYKPFWVLLLGFASSAYLPSLVWAIGVYPEGPPLLGADQAATGLMFLALSASKIRYPAIAASVGWASFAFFISSAAGFTNGGWILQTAAALVGLVGAILLQVSSLLPEKDRYANRRIERQPDQGAKRMPSQKALPIAIESRDGQADEITKLLEDSAEYGDDPQIKMKVLETYLARGWPEEAAQAGRIIIDDLIRQDRIAEASYFYRKITDAIGGFAINPHILNLLLEERLEAGDPVSASLLANALIQSDPGFSRLPDLISELVHLIAGNLGTDSDITKRWIALMVENFPSHPETKQLRVELSTGELERLASTMNPGVGKIRALVAKSRIEEAIETLLSEQKTIASLDPLEIYGIVNPVLDKDDMLKRAIALMELTVRAHPDDANIAELIVELALLYQSRMDNQTQARQWKQYVIRRWPDSSAAARIRAMIN